MYLKKVLLSQSCRICYIYGHYLFVSSYVISTVFQAVLSTACFPKKNCYFFSAKDVDYDNIDWDSSENLRTERPSQPAGINWSHFKDKLQIGDKVRSRKLKTSCTPETKIGRAHV